MKDKIFKAGQSELTLKVRLQGLYKHCLMAVAQMPKQYKPTIGVDLREAISTLRHFTNSGLKLIHKQTALREADIALEDLRDIIWVAFELRCISEGQFGIWAEEIAAVGGMLGGWIKSVQKG